MPTEEPGATQTRRKVRWVGKRRESKPGPKRGRKPFEPGDMEWKPLGEGSTLARRARVKREQQRAEAEWIAHHFQLDGTKLGKGESTATLSLSGRKTRQDNLTAFPRMPDHELQELQRIIGAYGLPIAQLDSDTAAFILRRVMLDYYKLNILRRALKPGMFTPDELLALLHAMKLNPAELGAISKPNDPHGGLTNVLRWLNEASRPQGIHAVRVNRLIEQYVRKVPSGGNRGQIASRGRSEKPATVERAARRATKPRYVTDAPLASAAKAAKLALEGKEPDA